MTKKVIIELDEGYSNAITVVAVGIDVYGNTNIKTASMSLDDSDCHYMHIGQDPSTNEVIECQHYLYRKVVSNDCIRSEDKRI